MPLPEKRRGQSKRDFLNSCMSNPTMLKEYPDQSQRAAICYRQFGEKRSRASYAITSGDDEIIYTIARVMLPEHLVEKMKKLPESGMGFHRVRALFKNGKMRSGTVSNCQELEFDEDDEYENEEVEDVEMEDTCESS